jgi:acyl-CoA thioester hydrolase
MKKKIYYHDTDCGGVVYYANYLKFLEEARTEFFAGRGLSLKGLAERGILFVVARAEMDYKFPARYADTLQIDTELEETGSVKLEFGHQVKNQDGKLICAGKAILVCVDKNFKPQAIPEDTLKKLSSP